MPGREDASVQRKKRAQQPRDSGFCALGSCAVREFELFGAGALRRFAPLATSRLALPSAAGVLFAALGMTILLRSRKMRVGLLLRKRDRETEILLGEIRRRAVRARARCLE